jgi:putative ABC transport system permease protein
MQSLWQDVRYGSRLMWRNPGFSLAAIFTLALGIGANSAIFSLVNVLSLKPLHYHDASRVTFVLGWDIDENEMRFNLHHADYLDLQRDAKSFQELAGYTHLSANLTDGDIPDRVQAYRVTPNTFTMLGVSAQVGRAFDASDVAGGRLDIAVISHALWQRRFGGDAGVIGRQIVVNDEPKEIVAVMPPRFEFPVFNFKGDLWMPSQLRGSERGQRGQFGSLAIVGRLRDGVAYAQAQSEVDLLMRGYAERYSNSNRGIGARVIEMGKLGDMQARPAWIILLVTVAMVLLLACANVANLLLARGAARQRELAVRAAIGASRRRIGRQMIVEGALLALGGGMVGVAIAYVALAALRASLPDVVRTTLPNVDGIGVDAATLGYTLTVSLLTSVIFGALPAWRASRDRFEDALKESAAAGGSRSARRLRSALVVGEVALATMLLVAAGLLARSYSGLNQVNPGFDPEGVMTMAMSLPASRYDDIATRDRFYEQVLARTMALPGVASAGLVNTLPFSTYGDGTTITFDGARAPQPGRYPVVSFRVVSDRYFETMRIPVIGGRMFDRRDTRGGAAVAIVNQVFAHRHFADRSAIGQRILDENAWGRLDKDALSRLGREQQPWLTIVGIVGDVRHSNLWDSVRPEVYVPMSQAAPAMMMLAARTPARPEDLTAPIRDAIRAIDPAQPVYHVKTLDTLVAESMELQRVSAATVTLFSAVALMLAAVGIYGVVSYGVSQQTREFGVRMALGATPRDVLRQVLRSGGTLVAVGMAIGIAGAAGVSGLLRGVLFGVSPVDPLTYAGVAVVLGLAGVIACMIPAWRASDTNPVNALRMD